MVIETFRFQPFGTRRLRGDDTVVALRFAYNPPLIAALKDLLRLYRDRARNRERGVSCAGGWLAEYRVWFVEESVWPMVAFELRTKYPALQLRAIDTPLAIQHALA